MHLDILDIQQQMIGPQHITSCTDRKHELGSLTSIIGKDMLDTHGSCNNIMAIAHKPYLNGTYLVKHIGKLDLFRMAHLVARLWSTG